MKTELMATTKCVLLIQQAWRCHVFTKTYTKMIHLLIYVDSTQTEDREIKGIVF